MAKKYNLDYEENLDISDINFNEKVEKEIENKNFFGAFLLIHSYLDSFLRDWIFYCGDVEYWKKSKDLPERVVEQVDRLSFSDLIHIHVTMGNIDYENFRRLLNFNQFRNHLAHGIITIKLDSKKTKKELMRQTSEGLKLCNIIARLNIKFLKNKVGVFSNKRR
ncbi:hypothetical protein K9L16_02670 [Candidatus Pacearchaeota archaeon]|nr:hypothetical protein [Candidatus Pacearchaeota archaeon]